MREQEVRQRDHSALAANNLSITTKVARTVRLDRPSAMCCNSGRLRRTIMTTVIECHPSVAAEPFADLNVSKGTTVNGVDTEKLSATIEAIKADASLANFQFRLSNQWVGGGENHSRIDNFYGVGQEMRHKQPFFLVSDEPEVLLSQDRGPNA